MAVQQFLLYPVDAEEGSPAYAAVASDGVTAVTAYASSFPEDVRESLSENFTNKVEVAKTVEGMDLMEVLRYNLYFLTGPVEDYETFEQAQAAAQEAFGE
jgi:hypothetical protein